MAPKLYTMDYSPPARSVYMTSKALGIELDHIIVNIVKQEQLKEDYLKINPQHTIPALEDDGKVIWDSHAINVYLITKYGKDDSLYPEDPYTRAVINQRLHFDSGILFALLRRLVRSMKFNGVKRVYGDVQQEFLEAYEFLEAFLKTDKWLAGDSPTLADIQLIATVTSAEVLVPVDADQYSNLTAWIKRTKALDYYSANETGLDDFKEMIRSLID